VYITYAVKVILTLSYRDVNTNAECLNYEGRLFLSLTTLKYTANSPNVFTLSLGSDGNIDPLV